MRDPLEHAEELRQVLYAEAELLDERRFWETRTFEIIRRVREGGSSAHAKSV